MQNISPKTHRAKKSMGQNFLKSESALQMMCEAGDVQKGDIVLEIGPGKGALTSKLLERAGTVIAVEKDRDLIDLLQEKFATEISAGTFVLVRRDILEFDPKEYNLEEREYKIVANIPYNITGAIIKKFLSEVAQPSSMTLLVQKEVAMRIVASDKKESILSLSVKAYGEPKYIMKVHKRFFSPAPKVDSAIIHIKMHPSAFGTSPYKGEEESNFFKTIHAGFAHKRKFVKKNLETLGLRTIELDTIFQNLNINPKARAEDLELKTWLELVRHIR
jgi:16S rRNA (adenine1518-N6/adenine1519-N6)-dimethyltransferase